MPRVVGRWQWGSLCGLANQKLHIDAANSGISISVYSEDNNKGWTMGGANCTQGEGVTMTVGQAGGSSAEAE